MSQLSGGELKAILNGTPAMADATLRMVAAESKASTIGFDAGGRVSLNACTPL